VAFDQAKAYFRPKLTDLHDPFLMKDMGKAVNRIMTAIDTKEKILVFGDYDVDGTTSVASMYQFICKIYDVGLVEFYIPHRYREGYGISKLGIDYAAENNFTLIISLDCGIKSTGLVAYAKTLGIDFIICDHHLPDEILPDAIAILNAKQSDCTYPYKELCGCGVGFKLMTALAQQYGIDEEHYFCYLDLVATAIAADIVPMTGENRILAYFGLERINSNPCAGIKALIKLGGIQNKLSINNVVFVIAPRINAAGRMDDAKKAVQLFIEKDTAKAMELAKLLHSDNSDRKEADSSITAEALALIENDVELVNRKSTVVYQEHWHKGVVGIVASRLTEKYYRPTIVLTRSGDVVAGSARSVVGYNLYEAVHACREYLLGYGGHFAAAGLSLLPENVTAFSNKFEAVVAASIEAHLLIPEIVIDSAISFDEINTSLYNIICQMEPFGPENMRPVFVATNVTDTGYSKIVKELHVRFVVKQHNKTFTGIGFNMADKFHLLQTKKPFDLVFTIDENEWNGETNLQLKIIDLQLSA
jgi:single-stranded-DNA-specific exonuclease